MFLTLEDPNAKIKGSRDPLGTQPIWAKFGRHIVANLTTQSTSVRGFTVLLLGRYIGARLIDEGRLYQEDALNAFLRMEQVGAYVRHVAHEIEGEVRGIERVKAFLEEKGGRIDIEAGPQGYILSDQRVYGLWGLYSVSARVSGLIKPGPIGLEPAAWEFIESQYCARLNGGLDPLLQLVEEGGILDTTGSDPVFESLAPLLSPECTDEETQFYDEYLRDALHTTQMREGRQRLVVELLRDHTDLSGQLNREEVVSLAEAARQFDDVLADHFARIATLEAVLAPAAAAFDFLLTRHARSPDDAAADLREHWPGAVPNLDPLAFQDLLLEIVSAAGKTTAQAIDRCMNAMASGNLHETVRALLDWNAAVMRSRDAAPWITVDERGNLDVRYHGSEQSLPAYDELDTLWRNGYFVDSLKQVTAQLE